MNVSTPRGSQRTVQSVGELCGFRKLTEQLDELFAVSVGCTWCDKRSIIAHIMESAQIDCTEYCSYLHVNKEKAYTRNLVATDSKNYTLLLLCWNPAKESKIHDHPCDGCFVRALCGEIQETVYETLEGSDEIREKHTKTYHTGQVSYMDDKIGLHKIGNPSFSEAAVTLHLYTPPFQSCKVWSEIGAGKLSCFEMGKLCLDSSPCSSLSVPPLLPTAPSRSIHSSSRNNNNFSASLCSPSLLLPVRLDDALPVFPVEKKSEEEEKEEEVERKNLRKDRSSSELEGDTDGDESAAGRASDQEEDSGSDAYVSVSVSASLSAEAAAAAEEEGEGGEDDSLSHHSEELL